MSAKEKTAEAGCVEAFNQGSDARVRGVPIERCPYLSGVAGYREWRRGWLDCHSNFGKDATWPVDPLPVIR